MRCPEVNPEGQHCGLEAAHPGVHQVGVASESAPPPASEWAPPAPASKGSRYGAGWWLRTAVFVVVALVVLGAISNGLPTPGGDGTPPVAGATSAPAGGGDARSPVTITGLGISKSKSFPLSGDYSVAWTATPDNDVGCYHGASLERADGELMIETLASEMLDSKAPKSGTTQLYNLDSASYYVDASSGCDWTFTFTPG